MSFRLILIYYFLLSSVKCRYWRAWHLINWFWIKTIKFPFPAILSITWDFTILYSCRIQPKWFSTLRPYIRILMLTVNYIWVFRFLGLIFRWWRRWLLTLPHVFTPFQSPLSIIVWIALYYSSYLQGLFTPIRLSPATALSRKTNLLTNLIIYKFEYIFLKSR